MAGLPMRQYQEVLEACARGRHEAAVNLLEEFRLAEASELSCATQPSGPSLPPNPSRAANPSRPPSALGASASASLPAEKVSYLKDPSATLPTSHSPRVRLALQGSCIPCRMEATEYVYVCVCVYVYVYICGTGVCIHTSICSCNRCQANPSATSPGAS
jgi:hypothetical protein